MTKTLKSANKSRRLIHVLLCAKAIGIFSCKISHSRIKSGKILDYLYSSLWLLCHIIYASTAFQHNVALGESFHRGYKIIVNTIEFYLNIIPLVAYTSVAVFKQHHFLKFFTKLEQYDNKSKFINVEKVGTFSFIGLAFLFFTTIIMGMTAYDILNANKVLPTRLLTIINNIPLFMESCCVYFHFILVYLLFERFKHLNKATTSADPVANEKHFRQDVKVHEVRMLYDILYDIVQELNDAYGFADLIFYLSSITRILISTHEIIRGRHEMHVTLAVIALFRIISLCSICHFTANQANRVGQWITDRATSFKHLLHDSGRLETILYFHNKSVFFTVAGFFNINCCLLLSMASTLLTYLVVFIQMA